MHLIGAVDIGGTKVAVGLVSPTGEVLVSEVFPAWQDLPYARCMEQVAASLQRLLDSTAADLLGIGVGCTGQMDPQAGRVLNLSFMPDWSGQSPAAWLAERFHTTGALENDADAAALAEWRLGAGAGSDRFIFLTISTGIGGGLVFDGQLYRGANGQHPELGHHTLQTDGPLCFCGNRGCWETLASGPALQRRYQAVQPTFIGDARLVCDLAEQGEPLAMQVVLAHGAAIGAGIANLILLYAPQVIVLGGGLMRRLPLFMDAIQAEILQRAHLVDPAYTHLEPARFETQSGVVGAALAWQHRFTGWQV